MNEITKEVNTIYTMWLREMLKFWHAKSRIIGALVTPLTIMFFLGPGLIAGFKFREGGELDVSFFIPGLISMAVLFASLSGGISIIWDKQFGILKEILIAPVSRFSIALGKAVGDVTIAVIQGILILFIGMIIGAKYISFMGIILSVITMFFIGMGFIGLGIMIASKVDSHEAFQMAMGFMVMPIIMVSGAFYPISDLPSWLKILVYLNPFTYGIETLRWYLYGTSAISIFLSITVIILFSIVMIVSAGRAFEKMDVC